MILCDVCGTPVHYGERHHQCGQSAQQNADCGEAGHPDHCGNAQCLPSARRSAPDRDALVKQLGFYVDDMSVLHWSDGRCRPATDPEIKLWDALTDPQQPTQEGK